MIASVLTLNQPFQSTPKRSGDTPEKLEIKRRDAVKGDAPAKTAHVIEMTDAGTSGDMFRSGIC